MENSNIIIDVDVNDEKVQETTRNDENNVPNTNKKILGKSRSADVWQYFDEGKDSTAVCRMCKSLLKATGGTTSGLIHHVETKHQIKVLF